MLQIDPFATTTNGLYLPKPDKTILNQTAIKSILFLYFDIFISPSSKN